MSRRKILADAHLALGVRRLQEQTALLDLRRRQHAAVEARQALDRLIEAQSESEASWAAALGRPSVDIGSIRLWRVHTDVARDHVRAGERVLAEEDSAVAERREAWANQLRLADAVDAVAKTAARDVRRAEDERRLLAAEDVLRARGRRK